MRTAAASKNAAVTTVVDGPKRARAQLLLAHGAGAAMDSPFMQTVAEGLARGGIRVIRFEFPYMAARREGRRPGPDRAPVLESTYRALIEQHAHRRLVIGGKSMGGRIAAQVAPGSGVAGVLCLGYPFHPVGKPKQLRLAALTALDVPALVVQGTRDPFGTAAEVPRYGLPASVRVHWIEDGDHSLVPRRSSGRTEAGNLDEAIAVALEFCRAP